jgi:hypothetical protein
MPDGNVIVAPISVKNNPYGAKTSSEEGLQFMMRFLNYTG